MSDTDLVRMVNQIAINQGHLPDDEAAACGGRASDDVLGAGDAA